MSPNTLVWVKKCVYYSILTKFLVPIYMFRLLMTASTVYFLSLTDSYWTGYIRGDENKYGFVCVFETIHFSKILLTTLVAWKKIAIMTLILRQLPLQMLSFIGVWELRKFVKYFWSNIMFYRGLDMSVVKKILKIVYAIFVYFTKIYSTSGKFDLTI